MDRPGSAAVAPQRRRSRYLAALADLRRAGAPAEAVLGALCDHLGQRCGVEVRIGPGTQGGIAAVQIEPPGELADPWLLGQAYEVMLNAEHRRRSGAHYTPPSVAVGLVGAAVAGWPEPGSVCDPTVGAGAFLLAAAEHLSRQCPDADGRRGVLERLHGADTDPLAVEVARASLAIWAGTSHECLSRHLVVADAFRDGPGPTAGSDLIVGNPPFLGQLTRGTRRAPDDASWLRHRYGLMAAGYVDTAALFLLRALELLTPGGRAALVQPHGTLATRDAAPARAELLRRARLVGLWFAAEPVFRAGVHVWAPVLETPGPHRHEMPVRRFSGRDLVPVASVRARPEASHGEWAHLVADLVGCPEVALTASGRVGDLAQASAGFRDQYYGLVGAVREAGGDGAVGGDAWPDVAHRTAPAGVARLVTVGSIDLLGCSWGRRAVRFAKVRYQAPVVDLSRAGEPAARWIRRWWGPKLLVATQTRVIEVAVDERGDLVPSTPVIAVRVAPDRLWHLAAALCAPPVSAHALGRGVGAALAPGRIKLSARQVLALPLPGDAAAWDRAAVAAREVGRHAAQGRRRRDLLAAYGRQACVAYGVDPSAELLDWWLERAG